MNKKQKEVQQQFLDNEKAVLKKIEQNYKDAFNEINSKIELLMARKDADMQHVIYQVQYQKSLADQVAAILEQFRSNEFETISEYLANAYEDGFIGTMYDLQGQGIPLVSPISQGQVVAAIQHETKLSDDLYTTLGKDTKDLSKKIAGEISRGISSGSMYSEIARNVEAWGRIPKNNAMRIVRTEAHRIQVQATADAQRKAKENGADVVKQWDAALDKKTRKSHRKLDGQIRELDEKFEVNGHKAMQPGGFGRPEEDINCRCALLQRARWALGNSYTKWSEDAPVKIADDGTSQLVKIEAKNYKDFKKQYEQAVENIGKTVKIIYKEAKTIKEAEEYTKSLGVQLVSFKGADIKVANAMNKSLVNAMNYSPEIKDNMNFFGVTQERNKLLKADIEKYYEKWYRSKYPNRTDEWYSKYAKKGASRTIGKVSADNWATAFSGKVNSTDAELVALFKKYSGVGVNLKVAKDAEGFLKGLKRNVVSKFHPIGCDTIESVFDHEFGHQLDYAYGLSGDSEIKALWKEFLTHDSTERDELLSRYAYRDGKIQEFIAEAYSEYLNNGEPRNVAKTIGEIIRKKVKGNE